ncbi:MAG: hypothetical protein RL637_1847 [Pseudomonadota bacterium]|jgi:hypothetical protein
MLISHRYQIIFVHIQRTGGNSIRQLLNQADPDVIQQLPLNSGINRFKHCYISDIHSAIDEDIFNRYTKFSIVRNPFDRLFSWYSMFKHRTIAKSEIAGGVARTVDLGNAVEMAVEPYLESFEQFVSMPNQGLLQRFYINQSDYLTINNQIAVDVILRFEQLEKDFQLFMQCLHYDLTLPMVNQSIRDMDYQKAYSIATQQLVTHRFHRDLTYFGYQF